MVKSYYKCQCAGRFVTVWPSGEAGFYDVVYGEVVRPLFATTVLRLTSREAASYVITELGAPHATTLDILTGMIERWRAEYDAEMREPVRS